MTEAVDREPIRAHFVERIGGDRDLLPEDGESLVEEGILDSFGLAELGAFLEQQFGVKVPDEDLSTDNLSSIERIAEYVAGHR